MSERINYKRIVARIAGMTDVQLISEYEAAAIRGDSQQATAGSLSAYAAWAEMYHELRRRLACSCTEQVNSDDS